MTAADNSVANRHLITVLVHFAKSKSRGVAARNFILGHSTNSSSNRKGWFQNCVVDFKRYSDSLIVQILAKFIRGERNTQSQVCSTSCG